MPICIFIFIKFVTVKILFLMRIKKVNIVNFKGFERKTFEFDNSLSVIVGNNTSGKTTLIQALQVALGAYLKSLSSLPNEKAYSCNFSAKDVYRRYNPEKKDFFSNEENTRVEVDADFCVTIPHDNDFGYEWHSISWWRELRGSQTTHSIECAGELMSIVKSMETQRLSNQSSSNAVYPVVLSFGANRIDNQYRAATKTKERASRIAKAYKSALRETVDFQSAFDWLYRYDKSFARGNEFEGTKEAFLEALHKAVPAMSEIAVDTKNNELSARIEVSGQPPSYQTYDNMSDGFKSIICIVAEIAHRCIELNGFLGYSAVEKTPGIVIIDELDLYLHPRWQKHILHDLQEAFPMVQFIVTSHSPFIIQSVRNRNVITLDGINDETDPIYPSIEEIVVKEMNMETPRSKMYIEMLENAEKYFQLIKSGGGDEAELSKVKSELDEMEAKFSDDPAYVALLKAERNSQ